MGDDVVLTGDLFNGVDDMMQRASGRIPPEKMAEQRAGLVKELTEGIHEFCNHVNAGDRDPGAGVSDMHRMLMRKIIRQQTDVKLIYQDFRKTVPKEALAHVEETVNAHFNEAQVKVLMKREKVHSLADLETALHAKGSSLDRERRIFQEQFIAQQWASEQLKGKESDEEITHEDMLSWYKLNIKEFEQDPKARWEELTVTFSRLSESTARRL